MNRQFDVVFVTVYGESRVRLSARLLIWTEVTFGGAARPGGISRCRQDASGTLELSLYFAHRSKTSKLLVARASGGIIWPTTTQPCEKGSRKFLVGGATLGQSRHSHSPAAARAFLDNLWLYLQQ